MMVRKVSPSQLRSMVRKAQQDYNRAVRKANRAIDDYNREVKRAVNNYNSEVRRYNSKVRQHNAKVHRNRQIINNQLRKMSTTVAVQSSYTLSSRTMQHYYEDVDNTYYEGVEITPEQESILDLVDQEQATSLVTENYIVNGIVPDELPEDMEIGNRLAAVSDDLNSRWKGAVFALSPNNPDATRHFCTSTREIFTQLLDMKAPDSDVLAFDPCCELTPERKTPTRKSKIAYLMRKKGLSESVIAFADADISNINELFKMLNGGTHGPAGKYEYEKLLQVKKRVEQGIIFLCEICA